MRMTTYLCLLTGLLVVVPLDRAWAQNDLKKLPGYVDFDADEILGDVKPTVEVFIEPPLLRILSAAAGELESMAAAPSGAGSDSPKAFHTDIPVPVELLEGLRLIHVQVFEDFEDLTTPDREPLREVAGLVTRLKEDGWRSVVRVPEDEESVDILMKTANDLIAGLVVLVTGSDELVFVNIAGEIDPEQLGRQLAQVGGAHLKGDVDLFSELSELFSGKIPSTPEGLDDSPDVSETDDL